MADGDVKRSYYTFGHPLPTGKSLYPTINYLTEGGKMAQVLIKLLRRKYGSK